MISAVICAALGVASPIIVWYCTLATPMTVEENRLVRIVWVLTSILTLLLFFSAFMYGSGEWSQ